MFTGLIEALGTVRRLHQAGAGHDLVVAVPAIAPELALGESIAINGVCLTVVERGADDFRVQVGPETLARTNLGSLTAGDVVNLERSLRLSDRLGGHLVLGHVDGTGAIARRDQQEQWDLVWFRCPPELAAQMVPKGSIAIDGVSLTLVDVSADGFSVALIPHTLKVTTLGHKQLGATVNLETDIVGKYIWKHLREVSA
jgi:riboflavin synthase